MNLQNESAKEYLKMNDDKVCFHSILKKFLHNFADFDEQANACKACKKLFAQAIYIVNHELCVGKCCRDYKEHRCTYRHEHCLDEVNTEKWWKFVMKRLDKNNICQCTFQKHRLASTKEPSNMVVRQIHDVTQGVKLSNVLQCIEYLMKKGIINKLLTQMWNNWSKPNESGQEIAIYGNTNERIFNGIIAFVKAECKNLSKSRKNGVLLHFIALFICYRAIMNSKFIANASQCKNLYDMLQNFEESVQKNIKAHPERYAGLDDPHFDSLKFDVYCKIAINSGQKEDAKRYLDRAVANSSYLHTFWKMCLLETEGQFYNHFGQNEVENVRAVDQFKRAEFFCRELLREGNFSPLQFSEEHEFMCFARLYELLCHLSASLGFTMTRVISHKLLDNDHVTKQLLVQDLNNGTMRPDTRQCLQEYVQCHASVAALLPQITLGSPINCPRQLTAPEKDNLGKLLHLTVLDDSTKQDLHNSFNTCNNRKPNAEDITKFRRYLKNARDEIDEMEKNVQDKSDNLNIKKYKFCLRKLKFYFEVRCAQVTATNDKICAADILDKAIQDFEIDMDKGFEHDGIQLAQAYTDQPVLVFQVQQAKKYLKQLRLKAT